MQRRSILRAGVAGGVAALLPPVAIGQSADARVLGKLTGATSGGGGTVSPPPPPTYTAAQFFPTNSSEAPYPSPDGSLISYNATTNTSNGTTRWTQLIPMVPCLTEWYIRPTFATRPAW
jgi:hypothetical protein